MNNKRQGTAFEKEFAGLLSEHGFWVHRLKDNENGQPFDLIAARDGKTYVIDCKDCGSERFRLSRVEENQSSAMRLWEGTGNKPGLFAIRNRKTGDICMVTRKYLEDRKDSGRSYVTITPDTFPSLAFGRWVRWA